MTSLSILPLWPTCTYSHFSRIIILKFRFLDATLETCIQQVSGRPGDLHSPPAPVMLGALLRAYQPEKHRWTLLIPAQHPTEPRGSEILRVLTPATLGS